jgi:hypothetical protein
MPGVCHPDILELLGNQVFMLEVVRIVVTSLQFAFLIAHAMTPMNSDR